MCQLQIYLDPRAVERVRPWLETPVTRTLGGLEVLAPGLDPLRRRVEDRGYEIYVADLTTADVASCGMNVVRVLVPGLVPNYAAAFPYLGRGRLCEAGANLGWRGLPLREDEIHAFPMPHA
jgi:ribosomal protein S12 methylthiotransferase accessory factor